MGSPQIPPSMGILESGPLRVAQWPGRFLAGGSGIVPFHHSLWILTTVITVPPHLWLISSSSSSKESWELWSAENPFLEIPSFLAEDYNLIKIPEGEGVTAKWVEAVTFLVFHHQLFSPSNSAGFLHLHFQPAWETLMGSVVNVSKINTSPLISEGKQVQFEGESASWKEQISPRS